MTKTTTVKRFEMEENYLTVSEVMRYLKISRSGAYALTRRKDFPVCLIGGSIRVPESLFLAWLNKQTYEYDSQQMIWANIQNSPRTVLLTSLNNH